MATEPKAPDTFAGLTLAEIAEYAHAIVCETRRALRDEKRITPWGMLSPAMRTLLLKCVDAMYHTENLSVLGLMNGFYRNHARIHNQPPPEKRTALNQFPKGQIIVWAAFHAAATAAIRGPRS